MSLTWTDDGVCWTLRRGDPRTGLFMATLLLLLGAALTWATATTAPLFTVAQVAPQPVAAVTAVAAAHG
jgi:hypothetical protein